MPLNFNKESIKKEHYLKIVLFGLFLLAVYFPLFYHLDYLPIRLYDESRRAINALEMADNGNFLITHYEGKPDMWGKPPLPIWFMAISMKLFGFDELGLRLPSALFGLGTVLGLFYFCQKYLKQASLGYIGGLILITAGGFIREHVTRTADYDVYLIFWCTAYTLLYFLYTESKKNKYLYTAAAFITLAVLTKSIAGLFLLPGLFIYTLLRGQLVSLLKNKHTYFAILGFIIVIGGYYLLRNGFTPYYLKAVLKNEIGGRYFVTIEGHDKGLFYYAKTIWEDHFTPWVYFLFPGIVFGLRQKDILGRLSQLLVLVSLSLFIVISLSKTQLSWYDAPLFPFLALLCAMPLSFIYRKLVPQLDTIKSFGVAIIFLLSIFAIPYTQIIQKVYQPERNWKQHEKELYGYFMREHPNLNNYFVCNIGYNAASKFYMDIWRKKGYTIHPFYSQRIQPPEAVLLICEKKAKKEIRQIHHIYPLMEWNRCELIKVTGNKPGYEEVIKAWKEKK